MAATQSELPGGRTAPKPQRKVYRNIHIVDIVGYRLPVAGIVSILHRVSGALMFLLLPLVLWALDASLRSPESFAGLAALFVSGGWFVKLIALALIWAYLHHLIAGVRHLWMDAMHAVSREFGQNSALVTLASSVGLTLALGIKLFL